jgi:S-formylglutathione hydrolase FrmB
VLLRDDGGSPARAEPLRVGARQHLVVDSGPGRPLLVLLHGRGMEPRDWLWRELYEALDSLGSRAPSLLLVDGGDASYYHDRRGFAWGTHVLREAIPAARRTLRTAPGREAIGGISMGGFGAFDLARLGAEPFCAVGGHSPALFASAGETPAGAFDDAQDFARHDVLREARRRPGLFRGAEVWIDVGRDDPFLESAGALGRSLGVPVRVWPGGHDTSYWRSHVDEYLRFYAGALADCV